MDRAVWAWGERFAKIGEAYQHIKQQPPTEYSAYRWESDYKRVNEQRTK